MIQRIKHLFKGGFQISTQMHVGIGGAVALTLSASLVAWFSLNHIDNVSDRVNEGSVPDMVASFGIAQYTGVLAAAAPRLTSAATIDEFNRISAEVEETNALFERQFQTLAPRSRGDKHLSKIRQFADRLTLNIEEIKREKEVLLDLEERTAEISTELSQLQIRLDRSLIPELDDQLYYAMTGYRELDKAPDDLTRHFSESEFNRYRHVSDLGSDSHIAIQLLASAFAVSEAAFIEPLLERFEAAVGRIEHSLAALGDSAFRDEVDPLFTRLFELALGEEGGFHLLARRLQITSNQQDLLETNGELAIELVDEVDGLVTDAESRAEAASQDSEQAIITARILLLAITAVSVVGAFLIARFFVGERLLKRLQTISDRMRRMAEDDLESEVEIVGHDEVAEMGAALEVLRQHALEVQRLNLVEKLANELQVKNQELETVLEDLHKAQDQIILKGKLAALGEVTAGVAHEIRNPLNFVHNFAESSEELLEELEETIDEGSSAFNEQQRELIEEISNDLKENLERIRSHGDRANRIVHDMLDMGRDTHELEVIDINSLAEEYSLLAYHSGRATDPDMHINMTMDFEPDLARIEVYPQDLGRVFLNLVTNACHATEEKRIALESSHRDDDQPPYEPTLRISTHSIDDGIEIRFRDNGTGIPQDVIDKIFNPFFTTKPTDKGTGLGLSLTSDIIRSHGGVVNVETEAGSFTEFIIQLPLTQPKTSDPASLALATE